jgi:hypothetical protein
LDRRILLNELPILDVYDARESARNGDVTDAIPRLRSAVDDMYTRNQLGYIIPAIGIFVETLLGRAGADDLAEAESEITRLENAPAEGSVIRDIWLLRTRALLAHATGDDTGYRDLRDRYRETATSLGFEGHMQWATAML